MQNYCRSSSPAPVAEPASFVLGEIVRLHVRADLEDNFRIDPAALDAVGRMAGNTWVSTHDRFELIRPK